MNYNKLDPGIREVVRYLRENGFNTVDSGDGKTKFESGDWDAEELLPMPHVFIASRPNELLDDAEDLVNTMKHAGIHVSSQTEAWAEIIEKYGNGPEALPDGVRPKPYIEATYDPVSGKVLIGLFYVTDDMLCQKFSTAT